MVRLRWKWKVCEPREKKPEPVVLRRHCVNEGHAILTQGREKQLTLVT
jgi:hypothetical protein